MNRRILIIVLVLLVVTALFAIVKYTVTGNNTLVNPGVTKVFGKKPAVVPTSTPLPEVPSLNAPKVIEYDGYTDLKKELESINPQVLESDFEF